MEKEKTSKRLKSLRIGCKVLLVNRRYAFQKIPGGSIVVGRLKTYRNINGEITPVFTEIGNSKLELTLNTYIPFVDEQEAINAIKS